MICAEFFFDPIVIFLFWSHDDTGAKCAKKCFRKLRLTLFCVNKKPKAKAAPPSPPAAPTSQPPEEDTHAGEHQPCMGGDCDRIVDFIDQMWKIPGLKSITVTNWGKWIDHMVDNCYNYYDRYRPPIIAMPPPRHGLFPPPPEYLYGLAEPPLAYHHNAYIYDRRLMAINLV